MMKYTLQELRWIRDLLDKAVLEAEANMAECKDHMPFLHLAELRRDNMQDLRQKVDAHIIRMSDRTKSAR